MRTLHPQQQFPWYQSSQICHPQVAELKAELAAERVPSESEGERQRHGHGLAQMDMKHEKQLRTRNSLALSTIQRPQEFNLLAL